MLAMFVISPSPNIPAGRNATVRISLLRLAAKTRPSANPLAWEYGSCCSGVRKNGSRSSALYRSLSESSDGIVSHRGARGVKKCLDTTYLTYTFEKISRAFDIDFEAQSRISRDVNYSRSVNDDVRFNLLQNE